MKRFITLGVAFTLLAAQTAARANYIPLSLKDLVTQSTIVARVHVVSVRRNPQVMNQKYWWQRRLLARVATVRVVDPFKGAPKGAQIQIAYDNGAGCPNVLYTVGDDCLVFLHGYKDRTYQTLNYDNGKKEFARQVDYQQWARQVRNLLK
jgi:hypothetical protein